MFVLVGRDGVPYESERPGTLGGHRRGRLYGRLDCPSALRALARGGYVAQRVFFADEATAVAAGYRPCAVCLPAAYNLWREHMTLTERLVEAGIGTVTVGHGRDPASVERARRFAEDWERRGGTVLAVVDWPETAASWLRQATRFAAGAPDAWVVAAPHEGWKRMAERLRQGTDWDEERTYLL
ncbi:hypothetical protein ACIBG8_02730 [Nonomuraea sp. NPDC050556]|uniref:hypothetical protein n=1 Tax=Nonomuraea sp. NPDC050556 TaxID=3364369 RepID=UPI0037ACAE3F